MHECHEPWGAGQGLPRACRPCKGEKRLTSAHGAPLLAAGRDCCHLLPPSPHGDMPCAVAAPLGAAPAQLAPSRAFRAEFMPSCHGWCHSGEPQPVGIRAGLRPCDVQVPTQESFPHPLAEFQILHLCLGSFKAAPLLWAVPGKMGNMLRLFLLFILGEQRHSSKWGFVVLPFSCPSCHQGLWKWRTGSITA